MKVVSKLHFCHVLELNYFETKCKNKNFTRKKHCGTRLLLSNCGRWINISKIYREINRQKRQKEMI